MAIFEIVEGAPGQGKSLFTARLADKLLARNVRWHERGNPKRVLYSNMKFSDDFERKYEGYISYWTDSDELTKLRDCDILWDEIATELDSRNWVNLSSEMKRFLSQYRKRGVDIYANTQDFSMIDARARLMISGVRTLSKIIGSRDLSTTKPPPRFIWGVIMVRDVENFRETNPEKKKHGFIPGFFTINKDLVAIYDTRQDIVPGQEPRLKHKTVYCEHYGMPGHSCDFHRVIHS
jgi:hypothetical protein